MFSKTFSNVSNLYNTIKFDVFGNPININKSKDKNGNIILMSFGSFTTLQVTHNLSHL